MNPKDFDNYQLASILRSMVFAGVPKTYFEKTCLNEAASRLELFALVKFLKEEDDAERN